MTFTDIDNDFLQYVEWVLLRGNHIGLENRISRTELLYLVQLKYGLADDRKVREAVSLLGGIYYRGKGGGYCLPRDMDDAKSCLADLNAKKRSIIARMYRIIDRVYSRNKEPVQIPEKEPVQLSLIGD